MVIVGIACTNLLAPAVNFHISISALTFSMNIDFIVSAGWDTLIVDQNFSSFADQAVALEDSSAEPLAKRDRYTFLGTARSVASQIL